MMSTFDELPPGIVDLISGYLDAKTLRSSSLSIRAFAQAYKRRCCETLDISLLTDSSRNKTKVLKRWEKLELLEYVRHVKLDDSGVRSQDGLSLFKQLFDYWLPRMTGLRSLAWNLSGKPDLGEVTFSALPPQVCLDVVCEGDTPIQTVCEVIDAACQCDGLRSLAIELPARTHDTLDQTLQKALLGCKNLIALKIKANKDSTVSNLSVPQHDGGDASTEELWTTEEVARLPALRDLDLDYPAFAGCFAVWAVHGNWKRLRRLTAHHDWILDNLAGHLPALESLSVGILPCLPHFLELQPNLSDLAIMESPSLEEDLDLTGNICDMLALPVGLELQSLQIQFSQRYGDVDTMKQDFERIATLCPRLQNLDIAISREQYRNAVNFFCWMDSYIQAVVRIPKLRRITLRLPRVIAPGTVECPAEFATIDSAAQLGCNIAAHGKQMQEVRIVASMAHEVLPSDWAERYRAVIRALPSETQTFTFIAQPPPKDWDAHLGGYATRCPELEQAEKELLRGQLSRLSATGEYTGARRVVDDMSTLVYNGTIVPKRRIRPMPVWLTPEQEQDRREGPPGPGRRAKRAVLGAFNGFTGAFRPPFTETSPRTAQERADAREVGFGGRPGWSKSSLATRIVWRR
ncbi:hypothetical protein Q7P37_009443 [Cladosporium fusiforme]